MPLVLIARYTSEFGAAELVCAKVVVGPLWFCVNDVLVLILLKLNGLHELTFNLPELHPALIFSYLVTQADHHWSIVVVITVLGIIIVIVLQLFLLTVVLLLRLNNLVNKFFIRLDTIRHISLAKDRIGVDDALYGLRADEMLQLVLNVD